MKRIVALLVFICIILTLGACSSGDREDNDSTGTDVSVSVAKKGVFVCNVYNHYLDPDIPMPNSERLDTSYTADSVYRYYKWNSDEWAEEYYMSLEKSGFTVKRMQYGAFAYNADSYIFLEHLTSEWGLTEEDADEMSLEGFSQPKNTVGISREEAKRVIPTDSELLPIDVTPEGLYEMTGGQIFMQPEYSFDDDEALRDPENKWYWPSYYYIVNATAVQLDTASIGVGDIDGDGSSETCILSDGPTSGVFTFSVDVYRDGKAICVRQCYNVEWQDLSFTERGSKLCVYGKASEGDEHIYDIALDDGTVVLSENGKPIDPWIQGYYDYNI
ncbi:MAG: hypothetical protein IJ639_12140 [Ruminococcus sp.]|nr:hypothetical protein [Ruminococcus sp.]